VLSGQRVDCGNAGDIDDGNCCAVIDYPLEEIRPMCTVRAYVTKIDVLIIDARLRHVDSSRTGWPASSLGISGSRRKAVSIRRPFLG
jgi:hypothetical protein